MNIKMIIVIFAFITSRQLLSLDLNLNLDLASSSDCKWHSEVTSAQSLVFIQKKIQNFVEADYEKGLNVTQSALKHPDPYINYVLQLIKALSEKLNADVFPSDLSLIDHNLIIKKVDEYKMTTNQLAQLGSTLAAPELGIKPMCLDAVKNRFIKF